MALTEIYVNPAIAGDSGAGTSGDPYGDLEYALEQTTRDSTNGDRFNIKAGTDEVLEFALDIVTDYGTPTVAAPLVFQGYTSTAGDGGIGGISGGGSVAIVDATTLDFVSFIDMHLHNTGSAKIVNLDQFCHLINCEMDNATTSQANIEQGPFSTMLGCYIHDIAGWAAPATANGITAFNVFKSGPTNHFTNGYTVYRPGFMYRNIIILSQAGQGGIRINTNTGALNNSIYQSAAGTGYGILNEQFNQPMVIANNLIEGFSGTGGTAIQVGSAAAQTVLFGGNAEYNTSDGFDAPAYVLSDMGDPNETLGASPFNAPGSDDFAPVDTGGVKEGSAPQDFGNGAI